MANPGSRQDAGKYVINSIFSHKIVQPIPSSASHANAVFLFGQIQITGGSLEFTHLKSSVQDEMSTSSYWRVAIAFREG